MGQNARVQVRSFDDVNGFLVRDLGSGVPAVGMVRSAPKVLRDGATLLARSLTYSFASMEQQWGGASAAVNAADGERPEALAAFVAAVEPLVADEGLVLGPGKGVRPADLEPLAAHRTHNALFEDHGDELRGLGAVVCADAASTLDGQRVAIEGFDAAGPEIVRAVYDRGGRVTAVGTAKGTVVHPRGLDGPMLIQAWREHGPALVEHVDVVNQPAAVLWEQEADVWFVGSKAGVVDHEIAAGLRAAAVVPAGPVPVTAKALAVLHRAGVTVLPDFLTTAAPLFALRADADATNEGVRASASVGLLGALREVLAHDKGPVLGACERAEAYLSTWRDELPFGRPLA
jgi:glutamate dehydrogenase/leucine dehydrogenase